MNRDLTTLSDTQLQELKSEIEAELSARDKQRKKEAAARMKSIAEAAGLVVTIQDKARKRRGRPPKDSNQ